MLLWGRRGTLWVRLPTDFFATSFVNPPVLRNSPQYALAPATEVESPEQSADKTMRDMGSYAKVYIGAIMAGGVNQTKVQIMKNATQSLPVCSLLVNSAGRFYPARSSFVANGECRIDGGAAPRITAGSWWARSYNQGLPAVGGRYMFLRGAWLPESPCAAWNASAS